jgi:hypothetical protein
MRSALAGFVVLLLACGGQGRERLPLLASHDFEDGSTEGWSPRVPEHWQVADVDGSTVYELASTGPPAPVRAPTSWSVLTDHEVTSFVFTGRLKSTQDADNPYRDLCVFFHFQDPTHFYYVHLSAISDEVHNIIGLVNGADRVKINAELPGESSARLTDREWHRFKVTHDAATDRSSFVQEATQRSSAVRFTSARYALVHPIGSPRLRSGSARP